MDIRNMIENKRNSIQCDVYSSAPSVNSSVYVSESDIAMFENNIDECRKESLACMGDLYIDSIILDNFIFDESLQITNEGIGEKLSNAKDNVVDFVKRVWKKLKEWFGKLINNIKILITPTSELAVKNMKELKQLYAQYSKTMTVNAPIYYYDPNAIMKSGKNFIARMYKVIDYIEHKVINEGDYDPIVCEIGNKKGMVLVDSKGKVDVENCKTYGKIHIVLDENKTQRKLHEALDAYSFENALLTKADIKGVKTLMKENDEMFKDILKILDSSSVDGGKDAQKVTKECSFWVSNYAKAMTTILNSYLVELKSLYRFTMALVKQLLRKRGKSAPNNNDENSNSN